MSTFVVYVSEKRLIKQLKLHVAYDLASELRAPR